MKYIRHYFVHAAITGLLIGAGCMTVFGRNWGIAVVIIMGVWSVKSAIDMVKYSKEVEG